MSEQNIGTVVQITGPVLDIKFAADALPKLLNAITIDNHGQIITVEVAQHIGQDTVRCIAMESTDGLVRGMKAVDTGSPITVPVGDKNLGRIFNLLGQPVDNKPAVEDEERWPENSFFSRCRWRSAAFCSSFSTQQMWPLSAGLRVIRRWRRSAAVWRSSVFLST